MDAIRTYCGEHGITISATYTGEAETATNMDRPGMQAMLAAARGEFEAVVIYDISCGSRDVGDWFTLRKTLMMLGIRMISTTQALGDLTDGNDFLLELLNVGLGHREVLEPRSKSIAGVAVKAKQGAFLAGCRPWGTIL